VSTFLIGEVLLDLDTVQTIGLRRALWRRGDAHDGRREGGEWDRGRHEHLHGLWVIGRSFPREMFLRVMFGSMRSKLRLRMSEIEMSAHEIRTK